MVVVTHVLANAVYGDVAKPIEANVCGWFLKKDEINYFPYNSFMPSG